MEKEIWKDIKGYEGLYQVSNYGSVKSLPKMVGKGKGYLTPERILKNKKTNTGYYEVCLFKDKKRKYIYVHRLVALNFIPNPLDKKYINHIDSDGTNNDEKNLEWCTNSENIIHSLNYGNNSCRGETHYYTKFSESDVIKIRKLRNDGEMIKNIAKMYNVTIYCIDAIVHRKNWRHI